MTTKHAYLAALRAHIDSAYALLTAWDGKRLGAVWFTLAGIVGTSRSYVRIHHASDVVGGLVVGRILGLIGRRIARRLLPA